MNLEGLAPFGLNPIQSQFVHSNHPYWILPVDPLTDESQGGESGSEVLNIKSAQESYQALEETAATVEEIVLDPIEEEATVESLIQENLQLKQICQTLQEEIDRLHASMCTPPQSSDRINDTDTIKEQGPKWAVLIQWRSAWNEKLYRLSHPKRSTSWFQFLFRWIKKAEIYIPPQW